ncbi:hypothetical protein Q1695_015279 [Nippostrongylus brasiliensis]|nr:hypothetical protein Q1695_015279 [Nippostrongylus brasiliensis]
MISSDKEESAALKIQYSYRKHLRRAGKLAENARKIAEWRDLQNISAHNTLLIEQLHSIRRRKAYELMKYENILQLPARKISEFLAEESECPSTTLKSESQEILERIEHDRRHKAAKIIQRAFKSYYRKKIAGKYLSSTTRIKSGRRVELIRTVNEKINGRKTLCKEPLTIMKDKLALCRAARARNASEFAKRELVLQSLKRDIAVLNCTTPGLPATPALIKCVGSTRSFSSYKASLSHREEVNKIEERLLDLYL